ncbi:MULTISPECIES: maleylpyruvate isomerase N-terminal domain-containing protein [Pseudofrankia]|uniref:maleylpyruvate isomerase N-terminal domain-containing protein n=1 Tax=Pseudofrankia TaxID=2994363 RepID=UPI000308766B|nr:MULTISPECIES: maleylpyruvate isomerase N-terminal domain-containing protein [Pseudofrankia]
MPVSTCPGWTLTQLLRHVARGPRWAAAIVRTRSREAIDPRGVSGGRPPADRVGVLAWFQEGPRPAAFRKILTSSSNSAIRT